MKTVQEKFFAALEAKATKVGLDLVVAFSFANRGVLHLQGTESFVTLLAVPFDFQSDRVAFGWEANAPIGAAKPFDLFPGRPNPRFALFTADELDEPIGVFVGAAAAAAGGPAEGNGWSLEGELADILVDRNEALRPHYGAVLEAVQEATESEWAETIGPLLDRVQARVEAQLVANGWLREGGES